MWAKWGWALLVLAAVFSAFVAGLVAPPGLAEGLRSGVQRVGAALPLKPAATAASDTAAAPTSGAAGDAAAGAKPASAAPAAGAAPSAAVAAPATADTSVPLSTLLSPAAAEAGAAGSQFALMAGQFASTQAAQQLRDSLQGQGASSTVLAVVDSSNTYWAVVTLGQFPSAAEAQAQRRSLALRLHLSQTLPVIRLPPPPPAKPPVPAAPTAAPAAV